MYNKQRAFSLIEIIIFIAVMGIALSGILSAFTPILKGSAAPTELTIAQQLALSRMEMILGQRYAQGFDNFTDPCTWGSAPGSCNTPSGYTVNATIVPDGGNANYKTITVTTSGVAGTTLVMRVADYDLPK